MKWLFYILVCALIPLAAAKEDNLELIFVGGSGSVDRLFFNDGEEIQEVGILKTALSDRFAHSRSGKLKVSASRDDVVSNGSESLITADLPKGSDTVLVVVSRAEEEIALECFAMPDLDGGKDRTTAVNLSKRDLQVSAVESKIEVSAGEMGVLEFGDGSDEFTLSVREAGDSGRLYHSMIWPRKAKLRCILLLFDGGTRARPVEVRRMKWSVDRS